MGLCKTCTHSKGIWWTRKVPSDCKDHSFQEGRKEQLIIDGVIVVGAGCLYLGAKVIKHFKKKRVTAEQANEAEQVLVEKMNEVLDEEVTVTSEF